MSIFNAHRTIGTVASLAASVLILGGCRGTAVKSGSSISSGTTGSGKAPFYRSYDSDNYESPANHPAAPFPGNADQIAPLPPMDSSDSQPEIPPAPSAQRSRWNKLQGGMKLPAMTRNSRDVSQTAAKLDHKAHSKKSTQSAVRSTVTTRKEEPIVEEVVQPRATMNTYQDEAETSGPFHSLAEDQDGQPPLLLPPDR